MYLICGDFHARVPSHIGSKTALLDHTKEVYCGVEACEGIKGTKQGDERGKARGQGERLNGRSCQRSSEKPIFQPSEERIAKEEGKSGVSSFSSLFLSLCLLSSPWVRLSGGSACPLGSPERRSGVCVLEFVKRSPLLPLILLEQRHLNE